MALCSVALYVYAFLERPVPATLPTGWQGCPIAFIEVGALAAAVDSSIPWQTVQYDDEQLLQAALVHDRVICDLYRQQPVLPLQFGTVFISLNGLEMHLERHSERYGERIRKLEGMGEYTLKLLPQFDQLQLDADHLADLEFERIQAQFKDHYSHLVYGEPQRGIERVHLLIPVGEEAELRRQVDDWQRHYNCWQLDLQGPLPPYHFA